MADYKVIKSNCPYCGKGLDGVAGVSTDDSPSSGDVTVCSYCFNVVIFDEELKLRKPTESEMKEMDGDQEISMAIEVAKVFRVSANADKN